MTLIQEWGNAAWFLFHSLIEKLNNDVEINIQNLINLFIDICKNLPCPVCAKHVEEKLKQVDLTKIHTKNELRMLFFKLHNSVNVDLGKSEFSESELTNKYKTANTIEIVNYFIHTFQKMNRGNFQMMFVRNNTLQCVERFIYYLNYNSHLFDA